MNRTKKHFYYFFDSKTMNSEDPIGGKMATGDTK